MSIGVTYQEYHCVNVSDYLKKRVDIFSNMNRDKYSYVCKFCMQKPLGKRKLILVSCILVLFNS